jgi:retron-type reverse transcriptase
MPIEDKHIEYIRQAFQAMQTKENLLGLLNYAKPLVFGDKTVPFELKQLTYYANPKICPKRYIEFHVRKKSGGSRSIHAPVKGLKAIQSVLSLILQCIFDPHQAVMGFVRGKNIVENAKIHAGNHYVFNIDLKDFFPSIDQARVWKCLQLAPFNLSKEKVNSEIKLKRLKRGNGMVVTQNGRKIYYHVKKDGLHYSIYKEKGDYTKVRELLTPIAEKNGDPVEIVVQIVLSQLIIKKEKERLANYSRLDIANIIVALCCTEIEVERKNDLGEWEKIKRNVLPQGAPTSPVITNIVCQRLDYLLTGLAKRFGLKYSRYADDITFSSLHNVYQKDGEFITELHRIIADQYFQVNEKKTRLQKQGYRQEVTGLVVNEKANVPQRYIKQLRMWLYYWERYGYNRAYEFFLQQYIADKKHILKGKPDMANVIGGKLDYLKMVKGGGNEMYCKLKNRLNTLLSIEPISKPERSEHLQYVLSTLFEKGLDKAMESYSPINEST